MPKFKYNPGDKIGPENILMIKRTFKEKGGQWHGKFLCNYCGKIFDTRIKSVVSGITRSCGCLAKENARKLGKQKIRNLTGIKFGLLTPIKITEEKTAAGNYIWLCQCECGNYKKVDSSGLVSGRVLSCGCLRSYGETLVRQILQQLQINFISEYSFQDCRSENNCLLYFDFYLPDYNCCIEYDGQQHFYYSSGWNNKENFLKNQKRDKIKNKYCKDNNIKLIRIPYFDLNKLSKQYILDLLNKNDII